jgi:small subunit ribosomal protein S3Ae
MSIADRRIQASQEEAMRAIIDSTLKEMGNERTLADMVKAIVSGDLSKDLAKACHVVIPIKRIEIRKSEVLLAGEGEPESIMEGFAKKETPAEEPAAEEEAPAEEPAAEESAEEAPAETEE